MPSVKSKKKPSKKKPAPKAKRVAADAQPSCRIEVTYKGRVQGVGFRFNAEKVALECGAKGWVRNEQNGDVKLVAEGSKGTLDALLEGIRRCPVGRHITKEQVHWEPFQNQFDDFTIEYHFA